MAATLETEFELEGLHESESEFESEWESSMMEGEEEFWDAIKSLASRAGSAIKRGYDWTMSPGSPQRAIALKLAHLAAQKGIPALGGVIGARAGAPGVGTAIAQPISSWVDSLIPQKKFESEWEGEISPVRKIYPDALMEHLSHMAAMAETAAEAEALTGAMVPFMVRTAPTAAPAIRRATSGLACGMGGVVRVLHKDPQTRPLIRTVPTILRRTAASIASQTAQGRTVSPQAAVRTMARQTATVLASPQRAAQAFRRSQTLDRQFHRTTGVAVGTPRACPNCARCAAR